MRLIQQINIPIKFIPFIKVADDLTTDKAEKYRYLVNMPDANGQVAKLYFDFTYTYLVPNKLRGQPVD